MGVNVAKSCLLLGDERVGDGRAESEGEGGDIMTAAGSLWHALNHSADLHKL